MEQEEVNISLAVGKVYSEKRVRTRAIFFTLFIVLSLHKRAFQCPDVMEIEKSGVKSGNSVQHKGGGHLIREDGNETTPGVVIYRWSVSH